MNKSCTHSSIHRRQHKKKEAKIDKRTSNEIYDDWPHLWVADDDDDDVDTQKVFLPPSRGHTAYIHKCMRKRMCGGDGKYNVLLYMDARTPQFTIYAKVHARSVYKKPISCTTNVHHSHLYFDIPGIFAPTHHLQMIINTLLLIIIVNVRMLMVVT